MPDDLIYPVEAIGSDTATIVPLSTIELLTRLLESPLGTVSLVNVIVPINPVICGFSYALAPSTNSTLAVELADFIQMSLVFCPLLIRIAASGVTVYCVPVGIAPSPAPTRMLIYVSRLRRYAVSDVTLLFATLVIPAATKRSLSLWYVVVAVITAEIIIIAPMLCNISFGKSCDKSLSA